VYSAAFTLNAGLAVMVHRALVVVLKCTTWDMADMTMALVDMMTVAMTSSEEWESKYL